MRTLRLLLLVAWGASCHLDRLFRTPGGGGAPASAPTARLSFMTQPNQATAGQSIASVAVAVLDSTGQPLTAFTGTVTIALANPGGGATLTGTAGVAAVNGVATFTDLAIDKAGQYTLRASAEGAAPATSTPITVVAPPPPPPGVTHLGFARQPLATTQAGATLSTVLVDALDAFDNVVADFNNPVTIALDHNPAGGTLSGRMKVNPVGGVATFSDLSIDLVGQGYTLRASTPGLASATSVGFEVTAAPPPPGGATHLQFTDQPQTTQAGQVMPTVRVTVYDGSENEVTTFRGNVTIALAANPGGGTLTTATPTIYRTGGSVIQWEDLVIDNPANGYTLRASSPGLPTVFSDPVDITPDPPPPLNGATGVAFYSQPGTTRAGDILVPAIRVGVQGPGGVIDPSYTRGIWITLIGNPTGATLSGTQHLYPVNGVAIFSDLRIDKPGSGYVLRITSWPLNYQNSRPFEITP